MQLQVSHIGKENGKYLFQVIQIEDEKSLENPVALIPPENICVENGHEPNLLLDLRWYLEKYLECPFGVYPETADRVVKALENWGLDCFQKLFSDQACDPFQIAPQNGLGELRIKISSDDPSVLSWPWEALCSESDGILALHCCLERQLLSLSRTDDFLDLSKTVSQNQISRQFSGILPQDRINMLLIIARPGGDQDVGYHSITRPVVDFVSKSNLPIYIDVLRPPTFENLQATLENKLYHIIHFDGHGGYDIFGEDDGFLSLETLGCLSFENDARNEEKIHAKKFSELLAKHQIPLVIMNACRSAQNDELANDPFASVACSLIQAGIRSVVAMSHIIYVSGAKEFVPAFYQNLFYDGNVAEAMRAGRNAMHQRPERDCFVGQYALQDWMVPVLYQQLLSDETIVPAIEDQKKHETRKNNLPAEVQKIGQYGFIGRERFIQKLEHVIRSRPQAGILIQGMTGIGKTTLAKGFLHWLNDTNGLEQKVLWFNFEEIRSGEYVINRIVEHLFGINVTVHSVDEKISILVQAFKEDQFFIVWDNFESASGIAGTEVVPLMPEEGRDFLKKLLAKSRTTKTKILITSRSPENWLSSDECFPIKLSGLLDEELWAYCNAVVGELGLQLDRNNEDYWELIGRLDGNPLVIRAVLLSLKNQTARQLINAWDTAFLGCEGDESTRRIQAAFQILEKGIDPKYAPIMQLIGLHEHYFDCDFINKMLVSANKVVWEDAFSKCITILVDAGYCEPISNNHKNYRMHPSLRGCLMRIHPACDELKKGFVDILGCLANTITPKQWHEQEIYVILHEANFYKAKELAKQWGMQSHDLALTRCLAALAQNRRSYSQATRLFEEFVQKSKIYNRLDDEGVAYHHLGIIAQEQRDFATAILLYMDALAIWENLGDERSAAATCHQLGIIAQEQRDFASAELLYMDALAIWENLGDEQSAAATYHQLGIIAQEQQNFTAAEQWYLKSLEIKVKLKDEYGAATTYHHLGIIAQKQLDFKTAKQKYFEALTAWEKQGNKHELAATYNCLGILAQEQLDFTTAEQWYSKALAIVEKLGNEYNVALTCHQLGMFAQEQQVFTTAEQWYLKALMVWKKQENEYYKSVTYQHLGVIAQKQREFTTAEQWYSKALMIWEKQGDEQSAAAVYHQLGMIAEERQDFTTAKEWWLKYLVIKKKQKDEYRVALTCHQLGIIAQEQLDFTTAEQWYLEALMVWEGQEDEYRAAGTCHQLGIIAQEQQNFTAAEQWYLKALTLWEKQRDVRGAAATCFHLGNLYASMNQAIAAGNFFIRASNGFLKTNDNKHLVLETATNYARLYKQSNKSTQNELRTLWKNAGLDFELIKKILEDP